MKKTLKLSRPLLLNGERVRELEYDTEKVTAAQFIDADLWVSNRAVTTARAVNKVPETDATFHLALGLQAVIACNPTLMLDDFDDMPAMDCMQLVGIGRDFIEPGSAGDSEGEGDPHPEEEPEEDPDAAALMEFGEES